MQIDVWTSRTRCPGTRTNLNILNIIRAGTMTRESRLFIFFFFYRFYTLNSYRNFANDNIISRPFTTRLFCVQFLNFILRLLIVCRKMHFLTLSIFPSFMGIFSSSRSFYVVPIGILSAIQRT